MPVRTIELPEEPIPAKIVFDTDCGLPLDQYLAFCRANPDLRCERTAGGEVVIVPPAGLESSDRNADVTAELRIWARKDGRGRAFDSSGEFILPDGSAFSPDGAWVSKERLSGLTRQQRRQFPPVCPEFVIEVMSPSDRLKKQQAKMEVWIANGCQLGWLIDADHETVYIYRPNQPPETRRGISEIAGEGPVEGFVLPLTSIWQGLG